MSNNPILVLSASDVRQSCDMSMAIEAMRMAFSALASGKATVPVRTSIDLEGRGGALYMPAYSETLGRHSIKIAGVHPENPDRGLDLVQAVVLIFDADTGEPLAFIDGKSVTAIRTGAGSGLATDLMANKDASVAVVIGAGIQAETQLEAVCTVRTIERAYCISRDPVHASDFAGRMSDSLDVEVLVATDRSVLREADIVCTATTSDTPILHLADVRPGTHINAVGTHQPHATEVDPKLTAASRLVVDHMESCLLEAGEVLIPIRSGMMAKSAILGELGEVVNGGVQARTSEDEITLFKSVGNAVQDLFLADLIVNNVSL